MNEKNLLLLKKKLAQYIPALRRLRKKYEGLTAHDHQWVFIILFCALLLRLPFIGHANVTQFDEIIFSNFVLHILNGQPFFDIHPPLARMLFAEIARMLDPISISAMPIMANQPFGDFPFVPLRYFVAFLGSLLPLIVYAIGRLLQYAPRSAALPALFIVVDNAFIIYSRTILPDTILLCFNFLALGGAFAMLRVKSKRLSFALLIATSIALGCALSIKWLALGVVGTIWLLFLFERRYGAIIISGLIAFTTYVAIFSVFFLYFPEGGRIDPFIGEYNVPMIRNIVFPKTNNVKDVLTFLPEHHKIMLDANTDEAITKKVFFSSRPIAWPTSRTFIDFGVNAQGQRIILQGNAFLWVVSLLLLCFQTGWILWHVKHKRKWPLGREETVLFAGYIINYLPFFFIHRPMHLYHYFPALIFLFLMIPKIAPRMIRCIEILSQDRLFAWTLAYFTLFLVFVNFIIFMPTIYGF
jgi:dolichyl-phosphate-mannose--protein O-mannosyl transferase